MDNSTIASTFRQLAKLMEYHGENTFKIRSYTKAYDLLRKRDEPVAGMDAKALQALDGIGKAISEKIVVLVETGALPQLQRYQDETPQVALDLLTVRGLGPGKVRQLVTELKVSSVGELLHAARENRVKELKGYSDKSQAKLVGQLELYLRSLGKALYGKVAAEVTAFIQQLQRESDHVAPTGQLARQEPILSELAFLLADPKPGFAERLMLTATGEAWSGQLAGLPVRISVVPAAIFAAEAVRQSATESFCAAHPALQTVAEASDEAEVFAKAGLPFVHPAMRDANSPFPPTPPEELLALEDIRGVVHAHTTYSDGAATLLEMATACQAKGYEYLTVTDHSKVATYANGLSIERLAQQLEEVRTVNAKLSNFTVFAGTECDILRDGSLDYPDEVLAELDIVIASVHSVLSMTEADATARLIRAVEHPNVHMIGHPTGRLLLSRQGYPVNFDKLLDACAANAVALEINASPYRLDLDWTYVRRAADLGIPISINPDAHSVQGIDDIQYGVLVAQKAGLRKIECLNALPADLFREALSIGSFAL